LKFNWSVYFPIDGMSFGVGD